MVSLHLLVVIAALVCFVLATAGVSWPRFNTFHAGILFTAVVLLGVA